MNSRERVIKTINHEIPDRVPLDGNFNPIIWSKLREHFRVSSDEQVKAKLGMDFKKTQMTPPASFIKQACPDSAAGASWVLSLGDGVFETEWGCRYIMKSDIANYVYHPIKDIVDLDEYVFPDISASGRFDEMKKIIAAYKDEYPIVGFLPWNFFKHAWELRGFQDFLEDLYLHPSSVNRLLDRLLDFKIKQAREYVKLGVDIIGVAGDIGMQNSMLIAPDMWREFFKPRLKSLISESRRQSKNIYWFFHSDGYIEPIITDLIEIGFDIINPIQPECMDPVKIKKLYGDQVTLHGTISLQQTLPFGSSEDVRQEVISRIEKCGYNGGLILAPANVVTTDVSIENILSLYQTAQNWGAHR
jgi:uroporphyrinogen decarboxylase